MKYYALARYDLHPFLTTRRWTEAAVRFIHRGYEVNVYPLASEMGDNIGKICPVCDARAYQKDVMGTLLHPQNI